MTTDTVLNVFGNGLTIIGVVLMSFAPLHLFGIFDVFPGSGLSTHYVAVIAGNIACLAGRLTNAVKFDTDLAGRVLRISAHGWLICAAIRAVAYFYAAPLVEDLGWPISAETMGAILVAETITMSIFATICYRASLNTSE